MKLLDRYVLRNFAEPFILCFFGFLALWLIFDLADNGQDFLQAGASLKTVGKYYLLQFPQIVIISLPVGFLLALLFSLTRMSRRNEIISMLTAGVGVGRVILPLVMVGVVCSAVLLVLNNEAAPRAEAIRKTALEQISRHRRPGEVEPINGYLFRDRMNGRTWYIRKFRPDQNVMDGVHITQQDAVGKIIKKWYAGAAIFDPRTRLWTLNRGLAVDFNDAGDVTQMENFANDFRTMREWTETPARIGSGRQDAQNLTIPELKAYLENNADFPALQLAPYRTYLQYRLAFPMQCFVIVFFACPLAIVFSRRGVVGGVATAMLLYAGLLLSTYLFLALGKGGRLDPTLASWIPNASFLLVGIILLRARARNRLF